MSNRLRDSDSADRAQKLHALGFSLFGGVIFALAGGFLFGLVGFVLGWAGGALLIFLVSHGLASRAGSVGAAIYFGSGSSTPGQREYSLAESYAARGMLQEAAAEYQCAVSLYPEDPNPPLRLARLYRDRLADFQEAVRWFRHLLSMPGLDFQTEFAVTRELVELYVHRMKDAAPALPVLARLADRHPDTPAADWARRELVALKRQVHT